MTSSLSRKEILMRQLTVDEAAVAEIERLYAAGELGDGLRTAPQCYVCCEKESRELVNKLLGGGYTNRQIAEACEFINGRRRAANDDRIINARAVWNHKRNHFNLEAPALAYVREVVERNADRANIDHINGIGHAVTPYAVLETAMVKGFQQLVDEERVISTKEAMEAATKYHEMSNRDAGQRKMADLMYRMDRILQAIWQVVPEEFHGEILRMVEGADQKTPIEAISEKVHTEAEKAVREFTPTLKFDEEDRL